MVVFLLVMDLILRIAKRDDESLLSSEDMWSCQFKLLSMVMPRNLVVVAEAMGSGLLGLAGGSVLVRLIVEKFTLMVLDLLICRFNVEQMSVASLRVSSVVEFSF